MHYFYVLGSHRRWINDRVVAVIYENSIDAHNNWLVPNTSKTDYDCGNKCSNWMNYGNMSQAGVDFQLVFYSIWTI